ncbi:iron uptake system protein EfeO [Streptomyces sp. NPDC059740]|uniref:iron uptake system protein EfeO n=1 Tax=Streptomyces sp. NPDC059740 TaxID=3346926 RepID=UPI00365E0929
MSALRATTAAAVAVLAAALTVSGCAAKDDARAGGTRSVSVTATDDSCDVSAKVFPAGNVTLKVANKGSRVAEVELLFPDDRIVTERENLGPGLSASLTAEVKAGDYRIACIPGMKGKGMRHDVKVTGKGAAKRDPKLDKAVAAYRTYAQEQADQTLPRVKTFTDAIRAGDLAAAKKAYAPSRVGWERTEPVAESFGDIDPKTDTRADGLEKGQKWTGWHRLEKALWQDKKIGTAEKSLATELDRDLADWQQRVGKAVITPTSMANGAKELLDEVATNKITGEEDRYSHTDLADFQANVGGAEKAWDLLKPVASDKDALLTQQLDSRFAAIGKLLDHYRTGSGDADFTAYDKVTTAQRKQLSDAVNGLAEPLSRLAATVVK